MFKFSALSDSYKIALAISLFFLINSVVSINISLLPSFTGYLIGFAVGITSGFVALHLHKSRQEFDASDVQIEVALDLCKQFSSLQSKTVKSTPCEVYQLIFAAKAHFPEASKPLYVDGTQSDAVAPKVALC